MQDRYILDGKQVVQADVSTIDGLLKWSEWMAEENRHVAVTEINKAIYVSTVFLGMDHGFGLSDKPILFETMVFRDGNGAEMTRCATWEEAEEMHESMVKAVKDNLATMLA